MSHLLVRTLGLRRGVMSWNDGRSPNFCLIFDGGRAALCAHEVPDAQQARAYSLDAAALMAHQPARAPASASWALPALSGLCTADIASGRLHHIADASTDCLADPAPYSHDG